MFGTKRNQPRRRQVVDRSPQTQDKRPSVFSYRASRSVASDNVGRGKSRPAPPTPIVRPSIKKSRLKRLVVVCLSFVAALVIGNNLLLDRANPDIVVIGADNSYRNSDIYAEAAGRAFNASLLNTNKVTVNTKKIEDQLRQEFPELAAVSVTLPFIGRKPTVIFEPSNSRLIIHTSSTGSFVVDENGRATATGEVVQKFKDAGLPEVQDQSQISVKLGDIVIPSTSVSYITEVIRQLRAKNIETTSLTLLETPSELKLHIKGEGYSIKFNTKGDARVAVGSFLALKSHLDSQQKKPSEYIDVRIENRAYYK